MKSSVGELGAGNGRMEVDAMKVLAAAAEGLIVVDRAGVFQYSNPAAEAILGLPATGALGRRCYEWTVAAVDGRHLGVDELPVIRALRTGQEPPALEHSFRRPDGPWVVLSQRATPICDEAGAVEGAIISVRDVTEARREANRVEQADRTFRTFIDQSPSGFVIHREGRLVYANPAMLSMLGYTPEDVPSLVGTSVLDWVVPEHRAMVRERVRILARQRLAVAAVEEQLLHRDGRVVDVEVSALPIAFAGEGLNLAIISDISKRKRAQRELARSHALLKATLQAVKDGLLAVDRQGRITAFNSRFVEMWHVPEEVMEVRDDERLMGFFLERLVDPAAFVAKTRQLNQDPETVSDDIIELKDGRVFERSSRPQYVDGKCIGRVDSVRDITVPTRSQAERERLLDEVMTKQELLQSVVDYAPVGISLRRGDDFVYELVNPAFRAMFGDVPRIGRAFATVAPEMVSDLKPILEHVLATGEPHHAEDQRVRRRKDPGGPLEDAYFSRTYVRVPGRRGAAVLGLVVDTTEHVKSKRRIEELAEEAQRHTAELESIHASMADGLIVCDAGGFITLVNDAQSRISGVPVVESVQLTMREYAQRVGLRGPEGEPLMPEELPLGRALRGERALNRALRITWDGRNVPIRVNATPIRASSGAIVGAVVVVRDVSHVIELGRVQDQFIRVAAHELKTPAAIMKGYVQVLLRSSDELSPPSRAALAAIDRGAQRIDGIVRQLLDVLLLQLGQMKLRRERVDLAEVVQSAVEHHPVPSQKHRLKLIGTESAVVQADVDRLQQVLRELLDNAIRYSPRGGDIDVAVGVQGGTAVVSVRDHGIGIPKDKQDHVFERFSRPHTDTPYDYGGMGVGLYVAREIVVQHGGAAWFESEEQVGSTFHFSLPLAA